MTLTPIEQLEHDSSHARQAKQSRRLLSIVRVLVIYGLLIGGSIIFTIPFIWMIGTSVKVDREMFGEDITFLPMTPRPAEASPYLDRRYFKPVENESIREILPFVRRKLESMDLDLPPYISNREEAVDILLPGVARRLHAVMPLELWELPLDELAGEAVKRIDDDMIRTAVRSVQRALIFGSVRARSYELQEAELFTRDDPKTFWDLSGDADTRIEAVPGAQFPEAMMVYDVSDPEQETIRLSRTLELPFAADRLYRLQLSIVPDDSWHRIDFYLEKDGKRYKTVRPFYLGEFQPAVAILQPFGPDDRGDSTKIRLWYAYKEVDAGPSYESRPDHVKIDVVMTESSQLQAWWAKCYRNYRGALNYIPFWRYFATSTLLVILNILGNIFSCSLVAYAFARLQWPGRNLAFAMMMATMMIPPQVTMIPYFLIIKYLGWYNTLTPLWIIAFFGNAFNIFLLRQFMKGIPRDLEDAARIDGCNFLQVYWHVIMPLIKPTLACISIFTFMAVWNDFMGPLIYLSDQRLYPLSLGLYALNVQEGGNFGMMMAGSFLMTLPVIIIFFFAQKYFIQGITLTGMKG